jgi:hypothetical protein
MDSPPTTLVEVPLQYRASRIEFLWRQKRVLVSRTSFERTSGVNHAEVLTRSVEKKLVPPSHERRSA